MSSPPIDSTVDLPTEERQTLEFYLRRLSVFIAKQPYEWRREILKEIANIITNYLQSWPQSIEAETTFDTAAEASKDPVTVIDNDGERKNFASDQEIPDSPSLPELSEFLRLPSPKKSYRRDSSDRAEPAPKRPKFEEGDEKSREPTMDCAKSMKMDLICIQCGMSLNLDKVLECDTCAIRTHRRCWLKAKFVNTDRQISMECPGCHSLTLLEPTGDD